MIRESPIAGSWYNGTRDSLEDEIIGLFEDGNFGPGTLPSTTQPSTELLGVIVPHAGYRFSGYTAAHSYKLLKEVQPNLETAIILGPNHRGIGPAVSVSSHEGWETPLGICDINQEVVARIDGYQENNGVVGLEIEATAHRSEHSIEIQIPFLQFLYGEDLEIVPICLRQQDLDPVGHQLCDLIDHLLATSSSSIAVIASTDLSHEYNISRLNENDQIIRSVIESGDVREFDKVRNGTGITMCGYGSVNVLLALLEKTRFDGYRLQNLNYTNSGMITGKDSGYTVGYLASAAIKTN